jgi:hypothetical protein
LSLTARFDCRFFAAAFAATFAISAASSAARFSVMDGPRARLLAASIVVFTISARLARLTRWSVKVNKRSLSSCYLFSSRFFFSHMGIPSCYLFFFFRFYICHFDIVRSENDEQKSDDLGTCGEPVKGNGIGKAKKGGMIL